MRLNPKIPISDGFQARIAAQSILSNQFDPKRTVAELRPDLKCYRPFFAKLMDEPAVQCEVQKIMDRTERSAREFLDTLWEWLERLDATMETDGAPPTRAEIDAGLTAARLLGKVYLPQLMRSEPAAFQSPLVIEGLGDELVKNLTGDTLAVAPGKTN